MRIVFIVLLAWSAVIAGAATFGTVVPVNGGPSDLVLDEQRGRLYIVNSTQNRIEVYSTAQRRLLNSIPTGPFPLQAAMSRDGRSLYVTVYDSSAVEVFDLDSQTLSRRLTVPSPPEAIAVGFDERVLITTTGTGNSLLLWDPAATSEGLRTIVSTLPPPAPATVPAAPSQVFNASRSRLAASADGRIIAGINNPNQNSRQVFVYEVESGVVLRSRTVTSISGVLSISNDGSKFMAGLSLFDTATLAIVAQQNAANSLYPFPNNTNFNTQQVQGGTYFSPDGSTLYSAFNITPVQNPAARANSSQFMLSDPGNLLIRLGLQLPENLSGKITGTADGTTLYALSQSGLLVLPVSTIADSPLALIDNPVAFVANDQCGVFREKSTARVEVRNGGRGQMQVTGQVLQTGITFTTGLAGNGPGGGAPGGGVAIPVPGGGVVVVPNPGANQGNVATTPTTQTAVQNAAPRLTVRPSQGGATLEFTYSSTSTSLGTGTPTDFLIQSPQAINIPPRVRVYQNNRNAEAAGTVVEMPISVSTAEALTDMVQDPVRQRIYIANSGLNRIEVFDMASQQFLAPIKAGQLPRSLALHPGGDTLYVANTGGESISMIDVDTGTVTGQILFPPIPYNAAFALNTPGVVAYGLSGLQILMSDGQLWRVSNGVALPRPQSRIIGSTTITAPRTMVAAPGGESIVLLGGNGTAYLYDAMTDDYVLGQTVASTPIQGYYGTIAAGPRGAYWVVNGTVLNSSLTPAGAATAATTVAAVTAVNATTAARFTQPTRTGANATVTTAPVIEMVDINTGLARQSFPAIEGPLSVQTGTQRVNVSARTMAVDAAGTTAYLLTASGLSIIPLTAVSQQTRPSVNQNGVVNVADFTPSLAPGAIAAIFGRNLGESATSSSNPLPNLLGGACVTLNNRALPVLMSGPEQMNVQIPPDLAAGRYPLIVRSIGRNLTSAQQTITIAKVAPVVFTQSSGEAAVFHAGGAAVSKSNKAKRDEPLTLFAAGLGATTGGRVTAGVPSPDEPLAEVDGVKLFFGNPSIKEAEIIVDWVGLVPGLIGVYRLDIRVPGAHIRGEALPVTVRVGSVSSPQTGTVPVVAVD